MKALSWLGNLFKQAWGLVVLLVLSLWWGLHQRQQRKRAQAQRRLDEELGRIERERLQTEHQERLKADLERATVMRELDAIQQRTQLAQEATQETLEQLYQEHADTGQVTHSAQTLFEQMRKEGRLP